MKVEVEQVKGHTVAVAMLMFFAYIKMEKEKNREHQAQQQVKPCQSGNLTRVSRCSFVSLGRTFF